MLTDIQSIHTYSDLLNPTTSQAFVFLRRVKQNGQVKQGKHAKSQSLNVKGHLRYHRKSNKQVWVYLHSGGRCVLFVCYLYPVAFAVRLCLCIMSMWGVGGVWKCQ